MKTESEWEYASPRNLQEAVSIMESVAEDLFDYLPPEDTLEAAFAKVEEGLAELQRRLKSGKNVRQRK